MVRLFAAAVKISFIILHRMRNTGIIPNVSLVEYVIVVDAYTSYEIKREKRERERDRKERHRQTETEN